MPIIHYLQIFTVLFWLVSCVSGPAKTENLCIAGQGDETPCRPFRAGLVKLNEEIDEVKPVGAIDTSSWVLSGDTLVGAVDQKWLMGISLKERKIIWWHKLDSDVSAPAGLFGSWAVVGLRDGRVLKLEILTGKKVWESKLAKFVSRPFELGGTTLLALTASQQLYALDFQTGQSKWIYDAGASDKLMVSASGKISAKGDIIYFGTAAGEVHAVNLSTGKANWKYNPAYSESSFRDLVGDLFVDGDKILVSRYDGLVTMLLGGGSSPKATWRQDLPGISANSSRGGVAYFGCQNGEIHALEMTTGRVLWKSGIHQTVTSVMVGEKVLYATGANGRIFAMSSADGTILWYDDVQGSLEGNPLLFEDKIYFATGLKVLYGYQML